MKKIKKIKKQQEKRYEATRMLFEAQNQRFCNDWNESLKNPTFTILKNELSVL
jgi:uncharacterized damage-inducible protein DinB